MKNASFFYFDLTNKDSTSNDKFYSTFKIQHFHAKGGFGYISVLQNYKKATDLRLISLQWSTKTHPVSSTPNWKQSPRASDVASKFPFNGRNFKRNYLLARSITNVPFFHDPGGKNKGCLLCNCCSKDIKMFMWIPL